MKIVIKFPFYRQFTAKVISIVRIEFEIRIWIIIGRISETSLSFLLFLMCVDTKCKRNFFNPFLKADYFTVLIGKSVYCFLCLFERTRWLTRVLKMEGMMMPFSDKTLMMRGSLKISR